MSQLNYEMYRRVEELANFLLDAEEWTETPEGWYFWDNIYSSLREISSTINRATKESKHD